MALLYLPQVLLLKSDSNQAFIFNKSAFCLFLPRLNLSLLI